MSKRDELIRDLHDKAGYAGRWDTLPTDVVAGFILSRERSLLAEIKEQLEKFKGKFTDENWGEGISHIYIDNVLAIIKEREEGLT